MVNKISLEICSQESRHFSDERFKLTKGQLLEETCNLFNSFAEIIEISSRFRIQDAIVLGLNGYVVNCNDGKLTNITKEDEKE